ncbi:hypothetical protein [Streptomonospora salina]|uniref:Uncharacterized protein n=1 Tax=Streptomonospora salina TaxID=104205 RepID=A0A841EEU7_9ACTN|nr:hypothetical protein [Streptomonospora salina]MBB5998950.1 hypothetical protein [Streptomonospora salina]
MSQLGPGGEARPTAGTRVWTAPDTVGATLTDVATGLLELTADG